MKPAHSQPENTADQCGIRILIISLFIILLSFFVVLNSISVVDERAKLEALGSLIGSFGILASPAPHYTSRGNPRRSNRFK